MGLAPSLLYLDAWDAETGLLRVVVETPRGSRNKYKYDERLGMFILHKVLPLGMVFPMDFGFIPSTKGDDGDPLDVLLLMDEPAFCGCVSPARLIGVIEAEQTADGETLRNDRLIAVPELHFGPHMAKTLKELGAPRLQEIEDFFVFYNREEGREFKALGRHGPKHAEKLVEEGMTKFRGKG